MTTQTASIILDGDGRAAIRLAVHESIIFPGMFFIGCHNSGVILHHGRDFASRADAEAALALYEARA